MKDYIKKFAELRAIRKNKLFLQYKTGNEFSFVEAYEKIVNLRKILQEFYDISPLEAAILLLHIDLLVSHFKEKK